MAKSPPWAKVWWDWYTTRSHIGLGHLGLALGPVLMLFGRAAPCNNNRHSDGNCSHFVPAQKGHCVLGRDAACALKKSGEPVSVDEIAAAAQMSVTDTEAGLEALRKADTADVSPAGAWFLRNLWSYQETPAARRMASHRANKPRNSDANSDAECYGERQEVRGKRVNNRAREKEWFSTDTVAQIFSELRKAAGGKTFQHNPRDYTLLAGAVDWAETESGSSTVGGVGPEDIVRESIAYFLTDPKAAEAGWRFSWWANDPGSYGAPIALPESDRLPKNERDAKSAARDKIGEQDNAKLDADDARFEREQKEAGGE